MMDEVSPMARTEFAKVRVRAGVIYHWWEENINAFIQALKIIMSFLKQTFIFQEW